MIGTIVDIATDLSNEWHKLSLPCTRFVANHRITILIDFYMRHFCSHQAFIPMICVPESTANVWVLTVKNAIKTMSGLVIIDIYRLLTHFKAFPLPLKDLQVVFLLRSRQRTLHLAFFLKRASRRVNSCSWLLSLQKNSELLIFHQPHKPRDYGSFFNMHRIVE